MADSDGARQVAGPDEVLVLCPFCGQGRPHPAGFPPHKVDPQMLGVPLVNLGAMVAWTVTLAAETAEVLTGLARQVQNLSSRVGS